MTKLLPLQRQRQWQTKEREEDVHEIEAELCCVRVLFYFSDVKYFSRIDQQHTVGVAAIVPRGRRETRSIFLSAWFPLRHPCTRVSFSLPLLLLRWHYGAQGDEACISNLPMCSIIAEAVWKWFHSQPPSVRKMPKRHSGFSWTSPPLLRTAGDWVHMFSVDVHTFSLQWWKD